MTEEEDFNIDDGGGGDEEEEDDSGGGDTNTLMNEFQSATLTENWGWLFSFQANYHVQHISSPTIVVEALLEKKSTVFVSTFHLCQDSGEYNQVANQSQTQM